MAPPSKRPPRRLPRDLDDQVEEEEESPRSKPKPKARTVSNGDNQIRRGWTDGQRVMDSTSNFAQSLKLEEKTIVIKFLDDEPYANFRRHWIERNTRETGKTLRAYTCPKTIDEDCPLCEVGDRPQAVAAFNVALIGDDGQVLLKSWDCGPRLFGVLKAYANDPKISPLTRGFFIASKTGKRGTVQHNVSPVSKTALEEDYDIEPPSQAELDKLERYDGSIVTFSPKKELRELAAELADEYE